MEPLVVRRVTLADEVSEVLRAQIIGHRFKAEQRVGIESLSRDLGVSATPVREALVRLAAEGLVNYRPLVGYSVAAPLDGDGFDRLMEARFVLEPELARLAAQRIQPNQADRLRSLVALDPDSPEPSESYQRYRAHTTNDASFHRAIAKAAANPFLERALEGLHAHLHIYRLHHPLQAPQNTLDEHVAIAEAIAAGDPKSASSAMSAHLDAAYHRHSAGLAVTNTPQTVGKRDR